MTVGELFVKIGVQGADKASKEIAGMGRALTDVSAKGLAAKAAVLGLIYGVTRLVSGTAQAGQSLANFGLYTGQSAIELQKWQISMRAGGATAAQVQGTVEGLSRALGEMGISGKNPEGLDHISNILGGIDIQRLQGGDVFYFLDRLKAYAQKETNPAVRNQILGALGLGPDQVAGLLKGRNLGDIKNSEVQLNQKQIDAAQRMNQQLQTLNAAMEKFQHALALSFGPFLLRTLQGAFGGFNKILSAVNKLNTAFPAFGVIAGAVLARLMFALSPITAVVAGIVYLLSEFDKLSNHKSNIFTTGANIASDLYNSPKKTIGDASSQIGGYLANLLKNLGVGDTTGIPGLASNTAIPSAPRGGYHGLHAVKGGASNNQVFNTTINGVEQKRIADETAKSIQRFAEKRSGRLN